MGIKADIQSLSPSALIELFELDMSNTTSGGKLFFHAGTNELMEPVVWQGVSYEPWPIKASGFDKTGQGTLPRPKIQVSNFAGTVSAEVQANDDLVGCRIIRKMTLARFLDAANFKDGNPTADPNQHFPDEMWFIEQKTLETHEVVEFELSSVFDLMGVQLPYRQIIKTPARGNTAVQSAATPAPISTKTTSKPPCQARITARNATTHATHAVTTLPMA